MSEKDNARKEFIVRMEASGITPTWETIYELNATIAELRAERDRIRQGAMDADNNVCQILGDALDYPLGEDGRICVGDHVAETLAAEAVRLITSLRGQLIEAQASMSFLQRQMAAAQADERARLNAAFRRILLLLAALCVLLCALLFGVAWKLGLI